MKIFHACLDVMIKYDAEFAYVDAERIDANNLEEGIRKVIIFFLQKHANPKTIHLAKFLLEGGAVANPCCYLNWLSDWSRATFFQCIRSRDHSKTNFTTTTIENFTHQKR